MAITSASEFEAVLTQVINRIEKEIVALGSSDVLASAHNELVRIRANARNGAKLKASRGRMDALSESVSGLLQDEQVLNRMWDLLDYIDYRA